MLVRTLALVSLLFGVLPPQERPAPAAQQQPKIYNLQPNSAGDCRMVKGTITLFPDGHGLLEATTLTYHTHSGDYWHIQLTGVSAGGTHLFGTGNFTGPRMDDGNPPPTYPWSERFQFDRSVFNDIARVDYDSHC